jgi:DNA-binding response OmpR family regulator
MRPAHHPTKTAFSDEANPRILMVDDDPCICYANAKMLKRHGYQVDVAENGGDAWTALQRTHYDLLVTDNHLPQLSGLELLQNLHAAQFTLPVIMASGAVPTEELRRHPGLNLEAILHKPYTFAALLGVVNRVLFPTVGPHWEQRISVSFPT